MNFFLVYQSGIANLFQVPSLEFYAEGRNKRVFQGDFRTAEAMARGAILAGGEVRVASCNVAGDIADLVWAQGMSNCPFRECANPPLSAERKRLTRLLSP